MTFCYLQSRKIWQWILLKRNMINFICFCGFIMTTLMKSFTLPFFTFYIKNYSIYFDKLGDIVYLHILSCLMMPMNEYNEHNVFTNCLADCLKKKNKGIVYSAFDYFCVCCINIILSCILIYNLKTTKGIYFWQIFYIIF